LHAVDNGAIVAGEAIVQNIGGSGNGEGARTFELRKSGEFKAPGKLQRADQHETVANVFAGGTVVAWTESVERIGNSVDVVEEFADDRAPGSGAGENIVGGEFETI